MDNISKFTNFWYEFDDMSNPGFVVLNENGKLVMEEDKKSPKHRIKPEVMNELKVVLWADSSIDGSFYSSYNPDLRTLDYASFKKKIESGNYKVELESFSSRQLGIICNHFPQSDDIFRDAFEYFGQVPFTIRIMINREQ